MKKIILPLTFLLSSSLWALDFGPETLSKLKPQMPKKALTEILKLAPGEKLERLSLRHQDSPCILEIHIAKDLLQNLSLSCDKALDPKKLLPPEIKWEKRPGLAGGDAILHDYVLGNPERGFLLHMNSEHQIISFHLGDNWKSNQPLKALEEFQTAPEELKPLKKKK